jgi:hypothetical protein
MNNDFLDNFSNVHDWLKALIWLAPTSMKEFLSKKFFFFLKSFRDLLEKYVLMRSCNTYFGLFIYFIYGQLTQLLKVLKWLQSIDIIGSIYRIWKLLSLLKIFLGL